MGLILQIKWNLIILAQVLAVINGCERGKCYVDTGQLLFMVDKQGIVFLTNTVYK